MSGVDNVEKVSRIEIIEDGKRKYVKWNCHPVFMLQDGGRTLKIFMDDENRTFKKRLEELSENTIIKQQGD